MPRSVLKGELLSRPTVVRTIQLLRKYVMNDNPVNIQVLSDQASNFSLCARRAPPCPTLSAAHAAPAARSSNTRVNYEEDNYNVGLPIFIIHGAPRLRLRRCGSARVLAAT